jgi:hypothetical protein
MSRLSALLRDILLTLLVVLTSWIVVVIYATLTIPHTGSISVEVVWVQLMTSSVIRYREQNSPKNKPTNYNMQTILQTTICKLSYKLQYANIHFSSLSIKDNAHLRRELAGNGILRIAYMRYETP